jgi:hypothetical protein
LSDANTPDASGPDIARKLAAKNEEEIARANYNAAAWKQALAKIAPGGVDGGAGGGFMGGDPATEIENSLYRGMKMRAVMQGLGPYANTLLPDGMNGTGMAQKSQIDPDRRATHIRELTQYLAKNGKSPQEIEEIVGRTAMFLDPALNANNDPLYRDMVLSRIGGGEKFGFKEMVETMNAFNQMRPQQQNSDPAALISAMAAFAQAFKEDRGDPVAQFTAGMQAMQAQMGGMNESSKQMTTELLSMYRAQFEQNKPKDFVTQMTEMRTLAETMGWANTPESEDITQIRLKNQHELDVQDRLDQRQQREQEWRRGEEAAKDRRQSELLKGITSTLAKVVESPVVKELGKGVGKKIGIENPLEKAKESAAKEQVQSLADPTQVPYGFTCSKCKQPKQFTAMQLEKIKAAGGRWVCDTPGCGEPYKLQGT